MASNYLKPLFKKVEKLDDIMFITKSKSNMPKIAKKLKELSKDIEKVENDLKELKGHIKERYAYFNR